MSPLPAFQSRPALLRGLREQLDPTVSAMPATETQIPRIGMLATVRNRRGLVTSVEPFGGRTEEQIHLVTLEYLDADGAAEDTVLWEREARARLLEPTALPDPARSQPMHPEEFDALVRATRWTGMAPFLDPDGNEGPLNAYPISAPLYGAIQVEDYQLVPLLKALRMPRVSLLLGDDVGLGKTIEAGIILVELILRRRVRRVLILSPAALRTQWKQELRDKFSLPFEIVDRTATHQLRKRLGMDANPWRAFSRVITSYDYLKQPDVLEQFRAASQMPADSPYLPWDLLIVDEAHNLSPAAFGENSDVSEMLRTITPWFEHRLFLTATPHNGHTRSFTGLLECLDPVRFTQKSEALTPAERGRVEQVVVRRLKREINAATSPPRFADRHIRELKLTLSPEEKALAEAYSAFRKKVRSLVARGKDRQAGSFAVEVLGKRLLSSPVAFADSWNRYLDGLESEVSVSTNEVGAAERSYREDLDDDLEAESRSAHAARTVGAWLKPLASRVSDEIRTINAALEALGLSDRSQPAASVNPNRDARFRALENFTEDFLRTPQGRFREDERLVIFTEYKTTLDYLERRLKDKYITDEPGSIRVLYGGMDDHEREAIKSAFNDPADPVRILVATDAASEGLNLQETARYLVHGDVPFNPSRLEQRNGRLDRHGQARDVTVHHFTTDDDADLAFLSYVVGKVHQIREDLGSVGDVFDRAFERRLVEGDDEDAVRHDLESGLVVAKGRADVPRQRSGEEITGTKELEQFEALATEVDLDPEALRQTLDVALGMEVGRPRLVGPDERGRYQIRTPVPPNWEGIVDESLRLGNTGTRGALPSLIFDPRRFLRPVGTRSVFRPDRDTALLHLGHPVFHRALAAFARTRFPGSGATRWTARRADVPEGADALLLVTVEEMAVNDLRETFHHWIRTVQFPIVNGELGDPLPHVPARMLRPSGPDRLPDADTIRQAQELWDEVGRSVRAWVDSDADSLSARLSEELARQLEQARGDEMERYQSRQGEVSKLIEQTTLDRLEREIASLKVESEQGLLFDAEERLYDIERSIEEKELEIRRRTAHYEELRQQLAKERDRIVQYVLPRRYALRGSAQVFPVAIEIRLPGGAK